jgi:hypothetical protein
VEPAFCRATNRPSRQRSNFLADLVASRDRNEALKMLHERAVIELNGHGR